MKPWTRTALTFIGVYIVFTALNIAGFSNSTTVQNSVGDINDLVKSASFGQIWATLISAGIALVLHFVNKDSNEKEK